MKRALSILLMAGLFAGAAPAGAQEACKTASLKNPALTLAEVYGIAEKHGRAWKADAVPAKIGNTSLGPLQPDGSSTGWSLVFYSAQADAYVSINTFRGSLSCWASAGSAGRIPDLKAGFFRDGAAIYAIAKKHGEALLREGHTVSLASAAAPKDRHATWYISYEKEEGRRTADRIVIVDANTGAVERVMDR